MFIEFRNKKIVTFVPKVQEELSEFFDVWELGRKGEAKPLRIMKINVINNFCPRVGDICPIDLPKCGENCLFGLHLCVVYRRYGSNYMVVPITSNRKDLHFCEYPIDRGRCGMYKNSKLKLDQIRPVSMELITRRVRHKADEGIMKAIGDFYLLEAQNIYKV